MQASMISHIDQYYKLSEKDREIVKKAARSGDSWTTREVLKRYFPKLSDSEITNILSQIRAIT